MDPYTENLPLFVTSSGGPKSLHTIPVKLLQKILGYCDFPAIQSLLKVEAHLRRFIHSNLPRFSYSNIRITVLGSEIQLIIQFAETEILKISYEKDEENRVKISSDFSNFNRKKSETLENSGEIQDLAVDDFRDLLKFQNGVLEVLEFSHDSEDSEFFSKFSETIGIAQLRARELKMSTNNNSNEILRILGLLNPENLRILTLENSGAELEDVPIFVGLNDIENMQNCEQWRSLEELDAPKFQFSFEIEDYLHFKKIRAQFLYLNTEHLLVLKQTFLASGPPKHFRFTYQLLQDHQNFLETFGPYLRNEENWTASWFYRTRFGAKILMVKVLEDVVELDFIEQSGVPEGAVVQD